MRDRVYLLGGLRSHIGIRYGIFKTVRPEVAAKFFTGCGQSTGRQRFRIWCFAGMQWGREEISVASRFSRRAFRKKSRL